MNISHDAILQAAATITAAKIQVGGAYVVASGHKALNAATHGTINSTDVLKTTIAEVLEAISYVEKNQNQTSLALWREAGKK